MTNTEAINVIQGARQYLTAGNPIWDAKKIDEAMKLSIEALQREVPKNPVVNLVSDADGSRRLNEGWTEDALLCPVCHAWFGEVFDEGYCRKCGQKIVQKRVRIIK